ncbi:ferritin family protein [Bosea sp. (in: a-proteobacteria)]|uniref:ferritin family protein n=1 Tax=Bosea sp. (in: a-proteobacteria) TaxID=1871050 RepID=UPI0026247141|nr:ferritin family protein [Bosea sp. (in: a-proteobacteria)]MCO5091753.1 rubrerythrin family protein [Bosea sp. (in: a-proteobacteria)]
MDLDRHLPKIAIDRQGGWMSLLKAEPSTPVRTLEELFSIAHAMEREAAHRYAEIAERMKGAGNFGLAAVFERLSADEQGHLAQVAHWSQQMKGKAPDSALIRWKLPETFDDEGISTTDPQLLSAYRALAMAVRNEERAFAFWSYVAAQAADPEIQQAAEAMAHEELGHVATLRRERRRAFHSGRPGPIDEAGGSASGQATASLERRLAELLEQMSARAPPAEQPRLKAFAEAARRHARELEGSPISVPAGSYPPTLSDRPEVLAEWLSERYLEAADDLHDEQELVRVQALAGHAIARLAWLRADLPELEGSPGG